MKCLSILEILFNNIPLKLSTYVILTLWTTIHVFLYCSPLFFKNSFNFWIK
jgi:hypothetical protein